MIEYLHGEFLDLLIATKYNAERTESQTTATPPLDMSNSASAAADLLGMKSEIEQIVKASTRVSPSDQGLIARRLALLRATLSAVLEARATAANISVEIARENQILNYMTRTRDKVIAVTNNANFYQIGILGMVIDGPLGLTTNPYHKLYGNRLTILCGLLVCGLTAAAFLEQHGGLRTSKAPPNMLGECFDKKNSASPSYSPLLLKYLNTVAPNAENNLTRKQELLTYWKKSKVLNINVGRQSSAQRLCSTGGAHHFWNEDMRLIRNRVIMLYDLRAMVDTMENGLSDMLQVAI